MNTAAQSAVGAGDDLLATDHARVPHDAISNHLRVFDNVSGVAYDTGDEKLAVGQGNVLPDAPFVLVADIAGFDRVGAGI
jgi:hypothetical protein